jgi:5-methylcytosine-specific restriction endonuclease McrA
VGYKNPEQTAEYNRLYKLAYAGPLRVKDREYRHTHREAIALKKRQRYLINREAILAKNADYKVAHREEILAQIASVELTPEQCEARRQTMHRYYENHRATYIARAVAFNQKHPEIRLRWAKTHPEQRRAATKRRKALKRGALINDLTAAQWNEIKAAYGHRCVYCGCTMARLTQDHLTPLSQGGAHTKTNVVPACQSCNSKKGMGPPLVAVQPLLLTLT